MKKLPNFLIGFLALITISGCEGIGIPEVIDPPELRLSLGPPPPPRITQVEITNGGGKIVMSGRLSWGGELSANPDRTDLDGALTIKSTWSDGTVTTQMATHTPNTPLSLINNRSRRGFDVAEAQKPSSSANNDAPDRGGSSD